MHMVSAAAFHASAFVCGAPNFNRLCLEQEFLSISGLNLNDTLRLASIWCGLQLV